MADIYQSDRDPNRILIGTTTGAVQAWKPGSDMDTAISISFDCVPRDGGCGHAGFSYFGTIADARSLAEALIKAADHVDALTFAAAADAAEKVTT